MTGRELRLRSRIDQQADLIQALQTKLDRMRPRSAPEPIRRCVYCGARTRALACPRHAQLVALDPFYTRAVA